MLEQTPRLNWAMLQKAKSTLHKDLVLYNEDHHPNHIVCFCPRFFLRGLCNTWDDPSVFRSLDGSPGEWRQKMLDEIPAHLSRRYSWSFCKSAPLPRGTVFLKRKKQFAKGRTIISYAQSLRSKLLEMASIALTVIAKTLYSQVCKACHNCGNPSTDTGQDPVKHTMSKGMTTSWVFFNAVPRKDILRSVHTLVREYQQHTGCSVLSIDLLSKTGHPGNPRGRTKSSLIGPQALLDS